MAERNSSGPGSREGSEPGKGWKTELKAVVVGDGGCGKTSLLLVHAKGAFPEVSAGFYRPSQPIRTRPAPSSALAVREAPHSRIPAREASRRSGSFLQGRLLESRGKKGDISFYWEWGSLRKGFPRMADRRIPWLPHSGTSGGFLLGKGAICSTFLRQYSPQEVLAQ